jgi:hypothetical protein
MLVLIVNLPPDVAGLRDLLKLLEESLSLDSLRFMGTFDCFETPGLGLAAVLAADEETTGETGIFFFWSAPLRRLVGGGLRTCGSGGRFVARIELLNPGAFDGLSTGSRIDLRIGSCPDEAEFLPTAG